MKRLKFNLRTESILKQNYMKIKKKTPKTKNIPKINILKDLFSRRLDIVEERR